MTKRMKIILKVILFTALPSILSLAAKTNSFLDYMKLQGIIGANMNLPAVKDILLLFSIILSSFLLSLNLAITSLKKENIEAHRLGLIELCKYILFEGLETATGVEHIDMDINIYVPTRQKCSAIAYAAKALLKNMIIMRRELIQIHVPGLSRWQNNENLIFTLSPRLQGMEGNCFAKGKYIIEESFGKECFSKYNYSNKQQSLFAGIKFHMCCPVFDNSENVVAVMAFSSGQKYEFSKETSELLEIAIRGFCQSLYEKSPELFKP